MDRRSFLQFLGGGAVSAGVLQHDFLNASFGENPFTSEKSVGLPPGRADVVRLHPGLDHNVVARWKDRLNFKHQFGYNNDYIALINMEGSDYLWVNHESVKPHLISGYPKDSSRPRRVVDHERKLVGGSFFRVKQSGNKDWHIQRSLSNFTVDGTTRIPFAWEEPIAGSNTAIGTLANCGGGTTPWGTILTCEENYDDFYGEDAKLKWSEHYDLPQEHYGWVVEVDPETKKSKKLVALGRFQHESSTCHALPDGRVVVYSGDDSKFEHLYRFVSLKAGSLDRGELFVADTVNGRWVSMDIEKQPALQNEFSNQTEVLVDCRKAAKLLGATPLDRPEDIEIDPITGNVFIALTNNSEIENYHGQFLKIEPKNGDHASNEFEASVYLAGGYETGFACPDNLVFDSWGNLWFTSDISEKKMSRPYYSGFGNNSLFVVPRFGPLAGEVVRLANCPMGAEFTGPCFSQDEKTLFLSVQHPGNNSEDLDSLTSHWPDGGDAVPRPSVIAIRHDQGRSLASLPGSLHHL